MFESMGSTELKQEIFPELEWAKSYLDRIKGKKIIVKYGGSAMTDEVVKRSVSIEIAFFKKAGAEVIVVHGGGKEIDLYLSRLGISSKFIEGFRYTDQTTLEVVEMVLSGRINKQLVQLIQEGGVKAIGISGKDGNLFSAKLMQQKNVDLGLVGEVDQVNLEAIDLFIKNGYILVVSPIGADENGVSYNINADYVAAALAGAWQADILCFLSDVDGLLEDEYNPLSLIPKISIKQILTKINAGKIKGGMLPKIMCCISAINSGVKEVFMVNGSISQSLLKRILENQPIGTTIYENPDPSN